MGCCNSTTRSPSTTPPPSTIPPTTADNIPPPPAHTHTAPPSAPTLPNTPLTQPSPLPTSPTHLPHHPPPWPRSLLEHERQAFFETRVTGNPEIWKALRLICEEVRQGNVAEAQAVMDAAGLTCPTGKLYVKDRGMGARRRGKGEGVFDERGVGYEVPKWVVVDPGDVVEDENEDEDGEKEDGDDEEGSATGAEDPDVEGIGGGKRRDEKGKSPAPDPGPTVRVRARLSDRGTDIVVSVGSKQTVADVVRAIQGKIGGKRVRMMFLGKTLDERVRLEESGWREGCVVNALVFEGSEGMISGKGGKKGK
ncbi:uncharacterized protein LTR77_006888 [Saxophila tyrrhenica]|uniref:DC-UbP/UBTD2 N-terminal domain-containing protein n=1 Tax=Saxophila tyrrhenica TaxID=1690608 RepID=A0AAV9P6G4_9PEZI|nr:hypothetical protein LTR77_006888 [Saxophila tyrrhenica]